MVKNALVHLGVVAVDDLDATGSAGTDDSWVHLVLGEVFCEDIHIWNDFMYEGVLVGGHLVGGIEKQLVHMQQHINDLMKLQDKNRAYKKQIV